ncbi:MAG: GerMN domain-containing protein [Lachnospiraceae bacterium]|nr:GerMN domain-containing protein [Lachnospiraceae bacterium]
MIRSVVRAYAGKCMTLMLAALCLLLSVSGCGKRNAGISDEGAVQVFYLDTDETEIIASDISVISDPANTEAMVSELSVKLSDISGKPGYEAPISGPVKLIDHTINEGLLTLYFDASYYELPATTEILIRAAIVRTFTQIEGIDTVAFLVDGNPLNDAHGDVVGNMSADRFIYNAGREINTYEKVQMTLYFADEAGSSLRPVYRTVVYNSNILMERLVVEQLIAGPKTSAGGPVIAPVINPATGIVNISVRDGICYVNLDASFLTQPYQVTPEVAIYSIVNSLAELPEVSRVQILVNGDSSAEYMDSMSLQTMYARNLDIVVQ